MEDELALDFEKIDVYLGKVLGICVMTRFIGSSITDAPSSQETHFKNSVLKLRSNGIS